MPRAFSEIHFANDCFIVCRAWARVFIGLVRIHYYDSYDKSCNNYNCGVHNLIYVTVDLRVFVILDSE